MNGWVVYIDANANGQYDAGEQYTRTGPNGTYSFAGLAAGSYQLGMQDRDGWARTGYLGKSYATDVVADQIVPSTVSLTASLYSKIASAGFYDENGNGVLEGYVYQTPEPEVEFKYLDWIRAYKDTNLNGRYDLNEFTRTAVGQPGRSTTPCSTSCPPATTESP